MKKFIVRVMIMFVAFMLFGCKEDGCISFTLRKCDSDDPKVFLDHVGERTGLFLQKKVIIDVDNVKCFTENENKVFFTNAKISNQEYRLEVKCSTNRNVLYCVYAPIFNVEWENKK